MFLLFCFSDTTKQTTHQFLETQTFGFHRRFTSGWREQHQIQLEVDQRGVAHRRPGCQKIRQGLQEYCGNDRQ